MTTTFTAHNIRLDDGSLTKPDQPWEMRDIVLLQFALRFLKLIFPDGFQGKRIVDLACLEGGYTVEFARAGFDSLGIEIRQSNLDCCNFAKANTNLPNMSFVCDDVRSVENYGSFDAVFCCGILYHLDKPRHFLDQMSRACGRVLIIDTHVASEQPNATFTLSEITENEGLSGRWYVEFADEKQRCADDLRWTSWENAKSFWPMKRDLIETLRQLGFSMVLEYPIYAEGRLCADRVTIVAVKD